MAGPANPVAPAGGFNKLFVMVPVMLAARKLDAEDPATVQYLRIAYGSMQTICVLVVLYTYMKASSLTGKDASNVIFVPAAPTVRLFWVFGRLLESWNSEPSCSFLLLSRFCNWGRCTCFAINSLCCQHSPLPIPKRRRNTRG
jgi:hypothetical protein